MLQLTHFDSDSNCSVLAQGFPTQSSGLEHLGEAQIAEVLPPYQGGASADSNALTGNESANSTVSALRSALTVIPHDVTFETWTRVIQAVRDGAPDNQTAESLLKEWCTEKREGEYTQELNKASKGEITVSSLFGIAKRHGWSLDDIPDEQQDSGGKTGVPDGITLADFEVILSSRGPDAESREVERLAFDLVEEASALSTVDVEKALLVLEEHGVRAKKRRRWYSTVKKARKERERRQAETRERNRGPSALKGGEITAWLERRVLESDHFAVDKGGALFYYKSGVYSDGGKRYLHQLIKKILKDEEAEEKSTKHYRNEVEESLKIDAPRLWETPPQNRICLRNGILNLDTGEVAPHSPGDWLMNRSLLIKHDPDAKGTAWRNFLESVMPDDAGATVGFELLAYLLGLAKDRRKAIYFYGGPNTGKSTLIDNIVEGIFGESNTRHIALQKLESCSFARADLFGRRLNVCADLPAQPLKGVSVFKQITGGDRMYAERKHEQGFDFTPHCHLLFSGNGPIIAPGAGEAFWDRWIVIPFSNTFSKSTASHIPKEELDAELRDPRELSALLNEVLPIIREGREVTQTASMKQALDRMRRHGEEEKTADEQKVVFPPAAGDGAAEGQWEEPIRD